jgi:hypothetical protein
MRAKVIDEALRVSKKLVIFGFPCGEAAWHADRALRDTYRKSNIEVPRWLDEHMLAPFPGPEAFASIAGWTLEQVGNDNLQFHAWLMRKEMSRLFNYAGAACLRLAPRLVESAMRRVDRAPYYRQIFILRRRSDDEAKANGFRA